MPPPFTHFPPLPSITPTHPHRVMGFTSYLFLQHAVLLSVIIVSVATASSYSLQERPPTLPKIAQTFCAEMHDYAVFTDAASGAKLREQDMHYSLCLNRNTLEYKRVLPCDVSPGNATCGDTPSMNITFIYTNQTLYTISPTIVVNQGGGGGGEGEGGGGGGGGMSIISTTCKKQQIPSTNTQIPFDFVMIDGADGARGMATYVRQTTIDGETVTLWTDRRIPNVQTMDWYVKSPPSAPHSKNNAIISDMARTTCYTNQSTSSGVIKGVASRDYVQGYTRTVPEHTFSPPKDCLAGALETVQMEQGQKEIGSGGSSGPWIAL